MNNSSENKEKNVMERIKELLKNKNVLIGTISGLIVVVIVIAVLAVSCGKNDNDEKSTTKTNVGTTKVIVEKKTTNSEVITTEPKTDVSGEEATTYPEVVETTENEEIATTQIIEEPETAVNVETTTETLSQNQTQQQTEPPAIVQPQPETQETEVQTTENDTEKPEEVKHYADNGREMSELEWNIVNDYWMEDVSDKYSAIYFIENEYGKGIQWDDISGIGGSAAYESDGDYKIVETFNGTYIVEFGLSVTIIYADGSFKEFFKPSSSQSSKYNEWMNDVSLNSVCKYGLEY